jgi:pimeloyl-ACP methyl ester carboxylesterase
MANFVLIHGAWHGAWCWERVAPLLRERGHRVATPDLPSHGADHTARWRVTLGGYAKRVCAAARELGGGAIAVGHSMGGMVITQAAAREPELFSGLIYLCAFAPLPGDSLMSLAARDPAARTRDAMERGLIASTIRAGSGAEVFYNTCSPEDARAAEARLVPQPSFAMFQRASAPRGPLPKRAYIECTQDRAISLALQREMRARAGIERVATLETDHSPFYSAPARLAETLDSLARELA